MQSNKTPIYQIHQIREFERLALERYSITGEVLMQRAGKASFDFLHRRFPQAKKIAIFCGGGNNGGDGYVLAMFAKEREIDVTIWQVGHHNHLSQDAAHAMQACENANIPIYPFEDTINLHHMDVIVDAVCGIGVKDNLRENIVTFIKKIQRANLPILSIDIPTGIQADTGEVLGHAVRATATITFIGLKLGLLTGNGIAYTGEVVCNDLQLPAELFSHINPIAEKIHLTTFAPFLKPRLRDWHKGLSGHVLIIGGELGFSGAPRLAAAAALRVGAGLVSVATRPQNALVMNIACPEIMCHGVEKIDDLNSLISKANVIVLGPGLGQSDWAKMILERVSKEEKPMVIDADGLNLLAKTNKTSQYWVLTPHPGEAARLLATSTQNVQQDRLAACKEMTKRYGGVCVLKGAGSLVIAPNTLPALCDKGNPGMASAGMGDVLSGVLGGLLAQGIPLGEAAKLGVCIHAMAGDLAAKEGERGLIATDLMPFLRRLCN